MTNALPNFSFHDIPPEKIAKGNLSKDEKIVIGKHLAAHKDSPVYANFFKALNLSASQTQSPEKMWDYYAIGYSKYIRSSQGARETAMFYSTEAHAKGRSPSYTFDLAKQLVGIPFSDKPINHERSLFLARNLNNANLIRQLHAQSRDSPIIAEALSRIAANFDNWDKSPPSQALKDTIEMQLKNLIKLSNSLKSLTSDPQVLKELTMTKEFPKLLKPFLEGEISLEPRDIANLEKEFKAVFLETQKAVEAQQKPLNKAEIQHLKKGPQKIKESSFKALAQLHDATVESKATLAQAQIKANLGVENERLFNDHLQKIGFPLKITDIPANQNLLDAVMPYLKGEKKLNAEGLENFKIHFDNFLDTTDLVKLNNHILHLRMPISKSEMDNIKINNVDLYESLKPFLQGSKILTASILAVLSAKVSKMGMKPAGIYEMNTSQPIAMKGITSGGAVFPIRTTREPKEEVGKNKASSLLPPTDQLYAENSAEQVNKPQEVITAYFKVGPSGGDEISKFETFAYNVADLLGLGEQFAGTKVTRVKADTVDLEARNQQGLVYNPEMLREDELVGSMQRSIPGDNLYAYMKDPQRWDEIKRPQLNQALLTSAAFGMFDQNPTNVIVTRVETEVEGRKSVTMTPKFFDNTRVLPNGSTGFVRHGQTAFSTTRCALLAHPEVNVNLKPEEREALKEEVGRLLEKVDEELIPYVNGQIVIQGSDKKLSLIPNFPPHWLDKKGALDAMKIRLNNINRALEAGALAKPRDIIFAADPEFKFVCALTMVTSSFLKYVDDPNLTANQKESYRQEVLMRAGYDNLDVLLNNCADQGIDPKRVYDMCNSSLTLENIMDFMITESKNRKKNVANAENVQKVDKNTIALRRALTEAAAVDFKDIESNDIQGNCLNMILEDCKWSNVRTGLFEGKDLEKVFKSMNPFEIFLTYDHELNLTLHLKVGEGQILHSAVDYRTNPGKLKLLSPEFQNISPRSVAAVQELLTPRYYGGVIEREEAVAILEDANPYTFLLFTDPKTKRLTLAQKAGFGIVPMKELVPTETPGVYNLLNRRVDLNKIEDFMANQGFKPFQNR